MTCVHNAPSSNMKPTNAKPFSHLHWRQIICINKSFHFSFRFMNINARWMSELLTQTLSCGILTSIFQFIQNAVSTNQMQPKIIIKRRRWRREKKAKMWFWLRTELCVGNDISTKKCVRNLFSFVTFSFIIIVAIKLIRLHWRGKSLKKKKKLK